MKGRASLTIGLGPESWQWLAFLFADAVTLAFGLVDDFLVTEVGEGALACGPFRRLVLSVHLGPMF
jgi:hypothetical protein